MLHVFLMIDMVLEPFSYMYCEIGVIKRYCRFVSSPRFPHPIGRVSTCTGSSNAGESKRPELSSFFLFFCFSSSAATSSHVCGGAALA